jgi:phenylacetate-CoA ligase
VDWFYGYTLMLDEFAQFVQRTGLDGRSLKLKCIVGTAEQMSELQRERLSEAFGCRVVDEYGCGETGAIAYECDLGRRHIMANNVYLEILDPNGQPVQPGQTGEIVFTELNNTAQPLIRYRVADMGALSPDPCPCGRGLPVLAKVLGRLYDVIYAPNGNILHGEVFGHMFKVLRTQGTSVKQYQVVQEAPDRVRFKIVEEGRPLSSEHRQYLETETRKRMGDEVRIEFEKVGEIPRLPSGKMRLIESRLERPSPSRTPGGPSAAEG